MSRFRLIRQGIFLGTLLVVAVVGVGLIGRSFYKHYRWKRFAVVEPGCVYRSGQMTDRHFKEAIDKLDLKTVICLNPDFVDREREVCEARKVDFLYYPMPSDGLGQPEQFTQILDVITDPSRQPVLVHCSAGVARTGASIAMYRMLVQRWSFDDAITELRSFERHGRCEEPLQRHISEMYQQYHTYDRAMDLHRLATGSGATSPTKR